MIFEKELWWNIKVYVWEPDRKMLKLFFRGGGYVDNKSIY